MEWIYHVDSSDKVLGKIERDEAHAKGLLHRSGVVFLVNLRGEVFITQRSTRKKIFPACFDSSSSFHVEYGESYEEAAERELLEECGVKPGTVKLEFLGKFTHNDTPEHQTVAVFSCVYDGAIKLDPEEASSGKFYSKVEVSEIVAREKTTPWFENGWLLFKDKV